MRMTDRWNDMTLGERIVLASWMAVRNHIRAQREEMSVESWNLRESNPRWDLDCAAFDPLDDEEAESDGEVREGAD